MIHVGVVDDDALVRRVLTTLLNTQDDISVTWAATDGDEALNHLSSSNQPDVEAVLLDIQMPHIDGITLATIIGTEFPQTATLILTTFTDRQLVDKALAVGVNGFIAKEDSIESIAGAIRQAVEGNIILSPKSGQHFRTTPSSTHTDDTSYDSSAQNKTQPSRSYTEFEYLSSREIEVLKLMVEALSNKQIARKLDISEATVKTHVSTLIAKLSVRDRVGAVVKAIRGGLA
ncbi:response regulator transcription factor [Actinomyces naeslundii]|uniref:Response regulator transcription factor n=1 Tax=Actinomyces naeslundii TaxID=1655 RepID=A0AA47IND9_ACTNA|nr:response regulator transcription factor [Actinomyces naeslundii]OMG17543.1 DNA-binding response regulator [Actinomyces naeslundii]PKY95922.1 DNA-binding response regulator [Actinomyces naeslundii]WAL41825.1 response regulator transcription factor [Actinomyces naeslundii]